MSSFSGWPDSTAGQVADKLTIETPEQTPLEFPLAGIGSRFLALAIDTLIQFAAMFVLVPVTLMATLGTESIFRGGWSWPAAIAILIWFCIYYGYFALFEAVWNGQTPGKRIVHLRVIQESGRPVTPYQAFARNLLRIVDQIPTFYAVGILTALLSRQSKRLGDYVAGTVVVHEKPLETAQAGWENWEKPASARYNASRLGTEEIQLLETFLQRRSFLSVEVRAQMSRQIADRLAQKLGVAPEERRSPTLPGGDEAFLEALLQERRSLAGYR